MDIAKRRLIGRAIVSKRYYPLLEKLTSYVAILDNIVTLETSDDIIKSKGRGETLLMKTYLFQDKGAIKNDILRFVDADKDFYLWTEDSNYCGLLHMPNMQSFNFDFDFTLDDPNGIIEFLYPDKKIVIDYYEESDEHYVDLKICQLLPKSIIEEK